MKLLICGGRDYDNRERLFHTLDDFAKDRFLSVVITGFARGADKLADAWAIARRIQPVRCPALWDDEPAGWGKSAGPIRNSAMLILEPDMAIAFPGGAGTADMVAKLKKAHVPVLELEH
jgi:hypothetical protein